MSYPPDQNHPSEINNLLHSEVQTGWIAGLRRCLADQGLRPTSTLVADYWQEDSSLFEGYIITRDRRVFRFE
jgi:hypothetical protein